MKKFITKIVLFIFIVGVIIIAAFFLMNSIVRIKADFKIKKQTKYIVVGHSHAECAFNDSLIGDFENFCNSGESYFYTLPKVKNLISQNPGIETVFIEFSNNQIIKEMNDWIWDEKHMSYYYPTHSPFIGFKDNALLVEKNFKVFLSTMPIDIKNLGRLIAKRDFNYSYNYGGYISLNKVLNGNDFAKRLYSYHNVDFNSVSDYSVLYLKQIIDFCLAHKKKVYLVRSPFYKAYPGIKNEKLFQEIREKNFLAIEFLDFGRVPFQMTDYADLEHLNKQGSAKFSKWFDDLIKKGLLDQKDKQQFIEDNVCGLSGFH